VRDVAAAALTAQATAAVQARYQMALHRPRRWHDVESQLLLDCKRPAFAAAALFNRPMGDGSKISGFSIRFAEVAARRMTNVLVERIVLWDNADARSVRCVVTDLETNLSYQSDFLIEKLVERRRKRKGQEELGQRYNSRGDLLFLVRPSEDELFAKESAWASKTIRQGVLRVLPGDIQDRCLEQIAATLQQEDKSDPLAARHRAATMMFALGVNAEALEAWLGCSIDRMRQEQLDELRRLGAAMREGDLEWDDVLAAKGKPAAAATSGPSKPPTGAGAVKDALGGTPTP